MATIFRVLGWSMMLGWGMLVLAWWVELMGSGMLVGCATLGKEFRRHRLERDCSGPVDVVSVDFPLS